MSAIFNKNSQTFEKEEVHRIQFKRKQQNRSSQQQRSSNLFVNRSNPTAADKPTTACYHCGSQGHFANKCEITKGKPYLWQNRPFQ